MATNWTCLQYDYEQMKKDCPRIPVEDHPLKLITVKNVTKNHLPKSMETASDPLSIALEGYDPLSVFANEHPSNELPSKDQKLKTREHEWMETWSSRRAAILIHYTTAEKLSIITSFLPGGEKLIMKTQTCVVDQVKTRLEQLDDFEEGSVRQMLDLSQQEYVSRIDMLNRELVQAWNTEQRVKALKIAIQCSKLLVDTSVMQFYPSKFVLITDILDIFGKLVYERLRTKAEYLEPGSKKPTALPENFTPDMVPELAKETCQNWLYKMASIRELVPRLYVEMSLLKCYSFLTRHEFGSALIRLTSMIRGIGHPLVAAYARFYLSRVGLTLNTTDKEYFLHNINDFLLTYPQIFNINIKNELAAQNIELNTYLSLYNPALDWLLYGIVHWSNASAAVLDKLVEQCKNAQDSDLLLRSVMASFKPDYIICRAMQFLDLISNTEADDSVVSDMLATLGLRACAGGGSADDKALLASAWRAIRKMKKLQHYLAAAEPWIQFAATHFSVQQINWLLGDIIDRVNQTQDSTELHPIQVQLQIIMKKVVAHTTDIEGLFTLDNILPSLELFKAGPTRVEVCKNLLAAYQNQQDWLNADQTVINNLTQICIILHESVNAVTVEDELKYIGELVCSFVRYVSFGRDFEKQLEFYVEARASFYKLEMVHIMLVQGPFKEANKLKTFLDCLETWLVRCRKDQIADCNGIYNAYSAEMACYSLLLSTIDIDKCFQLQLASDGVLVNSLSVETRRVVIGKHTKKTGWFVNACAAYCFVTVPAILCPFNKVQLYLLSGQVALLNHCRSQAEDCFKEALNVLPDVPSKRTIDGQLRSTDAFLVSYLSAFMSTLLLMASEASTLNLVKGLLKSLNHLSWEATNPSRYTILLKAIDLLANMAQENYLYQNTYVTFNDRLYRPKPNFIAEVNKMCALLVEEILSILKQLGVNNENHKQSSLALELFWRVIRRSDTNVKENQMLAVNLWNLAHRYKECVDHKMSNSLMALLQSPCSNTGISPNIIGKLKTIR